MKAYNYAIADEYKAKFVIPYIGLEFSGWGNFIGSLLVIVTVIVVVGFPLSTLMGSNGFLVGAGLACIIVFSFITYNNEINNETGRSKISEFYYLNIKNYRVVYDSNGNKRFLEKRKKGVLYVAHR